MVRSKYVKVLFIFYMEGCILRVSIIIIMINLYNCPFNSYYKNIF